jgi:hypothetical protein
MREYYAEIGDSGLGSIAALCSAAPPAVTPLSAIVDHSDKGENHVLLIF